MNERDDIELLILRVEEMMDAQRHYFKHKTDTWLKTSKGKEANVSELLKQMRRKGYNPDRFKSSVSEAIFLMIARIALNQSRTREF